LPDLRGNINGLESSKPIVEHLYDIVTMMNGVRRDHNECVVSDSEDSCICDFNWRIYRTQNQLARFSSSNSESLATKAPAALKLSPAMSFISC
jgi:hypothetical protein